MAAWVTGKVWQLREGASEKDLLRVLDQGIATHYARLHPSVRLGLLRLGEGRYLAVQRWPDHRTFEETTSGAAYQEWSQQYRAVLEQWEALATFVEEWAGEELR